MKSSVYLILSITVLLIFASSCKKDESQPAPVAPAGYLCTGKGSNSFYPLAINNEWRYPGFFNNSKLVFIRQSKIFGTQTYFKIEDDYGGQYGYFRDESNGGIFTVDTASSVETIFIPSSPVLNEEWLFQNGSRKITSLSATVITNSCSYLNCLELTYKDQSGNITLVEYYKRGIGRVSYKTYPPPGLGNPIQWNLDGLILN